MVGTSATTEQPPPVSVHRFTVDEYRRMGELAILSEDDRVELLEGWVVPKMVHNPPHDATIELIDAALRPVLPEGYRLRIQSSITTADSEPEPDLTVVRGTARDHATRYPVPEETDVVIEVADASLSRDRGTKLRLYARAGIACYWIVNLVARQVEIHEGPSGERGEPNYRKRTIYGEDERVPFVLGGRPLVDVAVRDILL